MNYLLKKNIKYILKNNKYMFFMRIHKKMRSEISKNTQARSN